MRESLGQLEQCNLRPGPRARWESRQCFNSDAVERLRLALGTDRTAITVPVTAGSGARERDCYANVRKRIESDGGRMQLGWAVWQHAHLFISESTALMNTVPGVDIALPPHLSKRVLQLERHALILLSRAIQPPTPTAAKQKVGRNDPCPCGSGKKYKKCHGA